VVCLSAGGYQLAVPPVPLLEELLVLSLVGVGAAREAEMAEVSATLVRSNEVIELFLWWGR